ncbi:uncharacterized protein MYCGRDRAFT_51685, partial [Zymoseptoria tritici IPO323]
RIVLPLGSSPGIGRERKLLPGWNRSGLVARSDKTLSSASNTLGSARRKIECTFCKSSFPCLFCK